MVALARICVMSLSSILFFSSASIQSESARDTVSPPTAEKQTSPGSTTDNSPVSLRQIGQCPTSPKPTCSDPNCQGPIHIGPMKFRCEATTAISMDGKDVILTGCNCCPEPIMVWCHRNDCRAASGTRRCTTEGLKGCACKTTDDRVEDFRRDFRAEDIPVLAEGEVEEDLIEVNDDGLLDNEPITQSQPVPVTTRSIASIRQSHEITHIGSIPLPTLGFNQQLFHMVTFEKKNGQISAF
ncbi:hypothetical protein LSUE1_G004722 [Lachnellula suecica]|uniref:Uncharacterized protein n=1 Tax=Lachnellula suecica TaxID=602035 RepID=A0A8T9CGF3_9HELO|nr:hypothetical protein LSUE1_G004722 [Lachnellula suecica]